MTTLTGHALVARGTTTSTRRTTWRWADLAVPRRHATTERLEDAVTVELINPDGLPKPEMYAQVGIATGTRTVYVAGQAARDADGKPVGTGDLAAQVEQAFVNVDTAVRAAGGTFDDVAKLTIYVVDWTPDKMGPFGAGATRAATRLGVNPVKPGTLIGVTALAEPDLLVEIEAIAVLP